MFILCVFLFLLLSGHWSTQCLPSCQSLTSLVWLSPWRRTPTFMTFMLERDKARGMCPLKQKSYLSWLQHNTIISIFICAVTGHHGAVVHWSRWRSLVILVMATVLTSACADLVTENIQPILNQPNISQVRRWTWAGWGSFYLPISCDSAKIWFYFCSILLG